jgi:hypothetical protein
MFSIGSIGHAIVQVVSCWLPIMVAWVQAWGLFMWDLWWTKWHQGRFSPSTSVSRANLYSTNCSTITIIPSGVGTIGQ